LRIALIPDKIDQVLMVSKNSIPSFNPITNNRLSAHAPGTGGFRKDQNIKSGLPGASERRVSERKKALNIF